MFNWSKSFSKFRIVRQEETSRGKLIFWNGGELGRKCKRWDANECLDRILLSFHSDYTNQPNHWQYTHTLDISFSRWMVKENQSLWMKYDIMMSIPLIYRISIWKINKWIDLWGYLIHREIKGIDAIYTFVYTVFSIKLFVVICAFVLWFGNWKFNKVFGINKENGQQTF